MKLSLFALGFLTGTLATYLILTQLWWPDVRLEAAHVAVPATARLALSPAPAAFPIQDMAKPEDDLPLLQTDLDRLRMRGLLIPVQGIENKSLRETFTDDRGGRPHRAIDIMATRGTPVLAAGDGHVEKLFTSRPGGLTIYQFDPQGEYCYYYAHLDGYAAGIAQGKALRKGDVIGYVGSTGNASSAAPHLHFTIFRLGPAKRWWEGTSVDPYPLWTAPPVP